MGNYPGLGLPLRQVAPIGQESYPIGAHGSCRGARSDMLPVRELAMMSVMDRLTDKEEWREEALQIPDEHFWKLATSDKAQWWGDDGELIFRDDKASVHKPLKGVISAASFDCCIEELRNKARYYEKSELDKALRTALETLREEQSSAPDWHPNLNDMVQDLVHPSMYPLVYGRSRVLNDEVVGVSDAINDWAGKCEIIPQDDYTYDRRRDGFPYGVGFGEVPPNFWSNKYQWLPSNVAFQVDGTVKFTSYINNLHPTKFPEIYRTIENLIETALPLWDQCLGICTGNGERKSAGRYKSRFLYPDNPGDENKENWNPSDAQEFANFEVNWEEVTSQDRLDPQYDDETEKKWKLLRDPVIPEPDFEDVEYEAEPGKRLGKKFRNSGLQVIVKLVSIELTPEKPEYPVGGWHVEGQMNEHICGTALYYFDNKSISPSNLSFRMQTSAYLNDDIKVGQGAYHWLEQIYGTTLGAGKAPCLQNYGSDETRERRLLAFPNVFQHRVSSFRLQDPTKPGHRRFIALWLVDPTQRVISTANVPPQQKDWWPGSVLENTPATMANLPTEMVAPTSEKGLDLKEPSAGDETKAPSSIEMGREHLDADTPLMAVEEAKYHRLELTKERSAFVKTAENGWQQHAYSFCEH